MAINVKMLKPEVIEVTYPTQWWDEYRRFMYVSVDPIARWCISNEGIKSWSQIGQDATFTLNNIVMKRARSHGVNYGIAISYSTTKGVDGRSFLTGARGDRELNEEEIAVAYDSFIECVKIVQKTSILTKNEHRALELTAQGFTQKEIARDMGKSPAYVKLQLVSAKKILRATSTTHAVTIAQQRGLIDIPGGMRW